jgi:hypothetical protein
MYCFSIDVIFVVPPCKWPFSIVENGIPAGILKPFFFSDEVLFAWGALRGLACGKWTVMKC